MKATTLKTKALHCLLALTLVTGLMVSPLTSSAYGESNDAVDSSASPLLAPEQLAESIALAPEVDVDVDVEAPASEEANESDASDAQQAVEVDEPTNAAN